MTPAMIDQLLSVADEAADAAGRITSRYFRTPLPVDSKTDSSPVTRADREAEEAIRAIITRHFPDHGILGEEGERRHPEADIVWVLDPIDGTKSFITGKPLFGTLIAVALDGIAALGLIDQPILGERWRGARGKVSTFNREPITSRSCPELGEAMLYATSPDMFTGRDRAAFDRVCRGVRHALYGADCYAYGLLASGHVDLVVEADLKAYDFAALVPVIEGAGGVITDWSGAPLTLHSDGRVVAAGDPRTHAAALALLQADTAP